MFLKNYLLMEMHGNAINDKLVAYVYNVIRAGIVNKHMVEWVYLFLFNDLEKEILSYLFDIIFDISSDLNGLISDILNSQHFTFNKINKVSLDKIINNLKESKRHILTINQQNIDNLELVQKLNNNVFDIILNNNVDIKSYFYKFDIDLDDLPFNECFFYTIIQKSPIENNITNLKTSLELNNNQVIINEKKNKSNYIKTYNTYNLINADNSQNTCRVIKNSTLTFVNISDLSEFDINFYFEKSAIKYEILNICINLGFCPKNRPNINKQIVEFFQKKKLSNIIDWLKDDNDESIVEYILSKTNKIKEIKRIFDSFFTDNKCLFFKYKLNFD